MKGSVARRLCRFFFVISADAPRQALGRDELFFSARNRTGPAVVLQNEPFQDFLSFFAKKKTKRRESFRSTVALPVLFL